MDNNTLYISHGTQRNWSRLTDSHSNKLRSRANKSKSEKHIKPESYLSREGLDEVIYQIENCPYTCRDIFTYLCYQKLSHIKNSSNVERFLTEYKLSTNVDVYVPKEVLLDTHNDWLGYLYQTYTPEGFRNLQGMYYTNEEIVKKMLSDVDLDYGQTFLDPCCGAGIFLMNTNAKSLSQLYGVDNDDIAVMIAKANLIALYPDDDTYPQIYCEDFLEDSIFAESRIRGQIFDFIYTNPPWGASRLNSYSSAIINSKERSSLFFTKAFTLLRTNGKMSFLLPSALLKIKSHKDFRTFVLRETTINQISLYKEKFNGVFTDFFSIGITKQAPNKEQNYCVSEGDKLTNIVMPIYDGQTEIEIHPNKEDDIVKIIEKYGCCNLENSIWGLGIVTGDNKAKIKNSRLSEDYEVIYTGKDVAKYTLATPTNYIRYDRTQLQQCAKDEIYRCPEKLAYKFISKTLCFAYDNSSSLFLNSANILIPKIEGMSIKTVLAFLNSDVFAYYYKKRFLDIKILKNNLLTLPFPQITPLQDKEITQMVDLILSGDRRAIESVNEYIFSIYSITTKMKTEITKELYGNSSVRTKKTNQKTSSPSVE